MPKSYSEQEREYIKSRLKEEASKCLAKYGVRRTTVDEIVKRVNIPKGTFYLFYKSKELLLFEAVLEQHELVNNEIYKAIFAISGEDFSPEKLTDVIFNFFKMAEQMQILNMLDADEVELLARKLPPEITQEHLRDDAASTKRMFSLLPFKEGTDLEVISAAFHAIFFATLHKAELGERYDEALRALIHGVVVQAF